MLFGIRLRQETTRQLKARLFLLLGCDNHNQLSPFHFRMLLNSADFGQISFNPLHHLHAQLLVRQLPSTVPERHLPFIPILEKAHQVPKFYLIISLFRAGSELHFLDLLLLLLLLSSRFGFLDLEQVFSIIHDFADNGICIFRNCHQIQTDSLGGLQCVFYGNNTNLLTICINQAYL